MKKGRWKFDPTAAGANGQQRQQQRVRQTRTGVRSVLLNVESATRGRRAYHEDDRQQVALRHKGRVYVGKQKLIFFS